MAASARGGDPHRTDEYELAVATAQVNVVRSALGGHGVSSAVRDDSPELKLTLLALPEGEVRRATTDDDGPAEPAEPLDRLLNLLYRDFEREYGGWTPALGKNRIVRPVTGAHNIGGGGRHTPRTVQYDLAPRDAEPGRGVRVGIADTALYAHPWLSGAYDAAPSSLWTDDGEPAQYPAGHATFVAGLVLQAAPGATVEVRRVLRPDATADSWDVAKQLVRFAGSGIDVLNLSFGCFTEDNRPPLVLATALDRIDRRVVVVAAAGNHGSTPDRRRPLYPAAFEEVVAVGATDDAGELQPWSPDPRLPWVDVAAPGEGARSTYLPGKVDTGQPENPVEGPFNGFAQWSGTSFAAARVSGAVAARTVPGEIGAGAALAELLRSATRLPGPADLPWIH